ncbi:hypothetical protein ACQKWADRAFT_25090 [Trichoderma austrokoningii]
MVLVDKVSVYTIYFLQVKPKAIKVNIITKSTRHLLYIGRCQFINRQQLQLLILRTRADISSQSTRLDEHQGARPAFFLSSPRIHLSCNGSVPPARPIHQLSCISPNRFQFSTKLVIEAPSFLPPAQSPATCCDATMPLFSSLAVTVAFCIPSESPFSSTAWDFPASDVMGPYFQLQPLYFLTLSSTTCYSTRNTPPSHKTNHTAHGNENKMRHKKKV